MLAWRLLLRDARSGELTVLFLAIVIAISSMTTVGFFADRVRGALENQAEKLLGADLVVSSDHVMDGAFKSTALKRGLLVSSAVKFPSMVSFEDRSVLTEIKAVGEGYPLRGELRVSNGAHGIPKPGSVWVDRKLLTRLDLEPGSRVEIGAATFVVDASIIEEPGAAFSFMSLGPGLIMNASDLPATQLIQTGSRIRYFFYAAGNVSTIASYRNWAKSHLERGQSLEDAREGSPEIKSMLDRAEVFLRMAALMSVMLSGVAIALSARRFVERHLDGCAVMRVLGATESGLLQFFIYQFLMLGLISSLIGVAVGFSAQNLLAHGLENMAGTALPLPSLRPAIEGCLAGLLLLLGFAIPPILALTKVPALHVMRREMAPPGAGYALGLTAFAALFLWEANDLKLGAILFGGSMAMLLVSGILASLVLGGLPGGGGSGWKYGLASLRRRRASSVAQILAFGLGLMAILVLTLVRGDLFEIWRESLPEHAPNRFVLNIQPEQLKSASAFFESNGMGHPEIFPMVRGRLVEINGRSVSSGNYAEIRAKRLIDREFNLSWASGMSADNELVAGKWWGNRDKDVFSVEQGLAQTLSIHMGDTLTFQVGGNRLSGQIVNLRKVDWNSFRVNFFVIAPPGLLETYPASYITSFYLPPENLKGMNDLAREFPNLLVVDVSSLIAKMQKMMGQAALAIEYVFLYSLFAGAMVLVAAFASTQDERIREAAILRTLGASSRQIVAAHASEFLILGAFSGAFAAMGATGIGYLAARKLLDLPFSFDPRIALAGLTLGTLCITIMGLFWTRKVLASSPSTVLRSVN